MISEKDKSYILYTVIAILFFICATASYYNLVVLKNFSQFEPGEEPSPSDLYIYQPTIKSDYGL